MCYIFHISTDNQLFDIKYAEKSWMCTVGVISLTCSMNSVLDKSRIFKLACLLQFYKNKCAHVNRMLKLKKVMLQLQSRSVNRVYCTYNGIHNIRRDGRIRGIAAMMETAQTGCELQTLQFAIEH